MEWHGIEFTIDAYYEFHHSIDQSIQIDIIERQVVDEEECSLCDHGIPKTQAEWAAVEREAVAALAEQIEEDIAIAEQERQVERMLAQEDMKYDDYRPYY
jgi:hypothetical protein